MKEKEIEVYRFPRDENLGPFPFILTHQLANTDYFRRLSEHAQITTLQWLLANGFNTESDLSPEQLALLEKAIYEP